ncbi:MAG TPA: SPOR domain-containing protein [Paenirhodobacter sp.]
MSPVMGSLSVPVVMFTSLLAGGLCVGMVAWAAPAEVPPASYSAAQYVDSTGCVFYRAAAGADWQPRQTRDGRPLCGYAPTQVDAVVAPDAGAAVDRPAVAPGLPARSLADRLATLANRPLTIMQARTIPGALTACPGAPVTVQRYVLSDGRTVMRCGPQIDDPAGFINGAGVRGLQVAGSNVHDLPLPATAAMLAALRADLRATGAADAPRPATGTRRNKSPSARAGAETGRYVQVGAFASAANADKVKARLRALGVPVSTGAARIGGKEVQVVYAGPLSGTDAEATLRRIRANGFRDAILR